MRFTISPFATSGFLTLASGVPLSVTHANGRPLRIADPGLSGPVGDRLGDKVADGKVINPYFNINAFLPLAD